MMRKIFFILLLIIALAVGALFTVFQSPVFWQRFIMSAAKQAPADFRLKDIIIERVKFTKEGSLTLSNIRMKCKVKGASYFVSAGSVRLASLWTIWSKDPRLPLEIAHTAVVADPLSISELGFDGWVSIRQGSFAGRLNAVSVEYGPYSLTQCAAKLQVHGDQLMFKDLTGLGYGGRFNAEIIVESLRQIIYSMDILFKNVNLTRLALANPSISAVKGIVEGSLHVKGVKGRLTQVQGDMDALEGGQIKAFVLGYLARYIPQRRQIEGLIKNNADIPLDSASISVHSVTDEQLALKVKLASSSLNLNMNVGMDVNIEGGLAGLLRH